MNLLTKIPPDSLRPRFDLKQVVYAFLLTNAETYAKDEDVLCSLNARAIRKHLGLSEELVESVLKELEEEEWIELQGDDIILGFWEDDETVRPFGVDNRKGYNADTEVLATAEEYGKAVRGIKKGRFSEAFEQYQTLLQKQLLMWSAQDFVNYYRLVYMFEYQEEMRASMVKEIAQMKKLRDLCGCSSLKTMIAYYLLHAQEFSKEGTTSIGHLLTLKDKVYQISSRDFGKEKKADMRKRLNDTF